MNRFYILVLGIAVCAGAAVLSGQVPAPMGAASPPASPGRYQLMGLAQANRTPEMWMIDTQTGDAWQRGGAGKWVYVGNPTVDPGTKFPATRPAASAPARVLPEAPGR